MNSLKIYFLVFSLSLASSKLYAARLPQGTNENELSQLVQTLAFGNVTKVMRSAEAYPTFPGFKIAIETTLIPSGNLNEMGDGSASLPKIIPSPRVILSKGIGLNTELSFNLSSQQLIETMASYGLLAKWSFMNEQDFFATSAAFTSFTNLSGFNDTFNGKEFEIGILASKDFVRLKPYLGLGLLLATASVPKTVCMITQQKTVFGPHIFIGAEVELPMNITLQLDFTDWIPSSSFALGYRF